MANLFERWFGGGGAVRNTQDVPRVSSERPVVDEFAKVRRNVFRRKLEAARGAVPVDDEELNGAIRSVWADGEVPQMSSEEMDGYIARVVQEMGWTPEAVPEDHYEPMQEPFSPMGDVRQRIFEHTLREALGRAISHEEVDAARAMFLHDTQIQERWNTMVGEEVSAYARRVAEELKMQRKVSAAAK